ncbi:MAG: hypothetical protein COU33_03200 [Candidatus Magasanikbacteria bacterium CG10_big_fil_rev_8_21_14_0_10_43_6]|uniref:Glycosyltransferase family 1 protein n=1 Tax=Candidatus Magasanikbacteria bacterium CG10_big_fil_rev_8_21_14_0_10_43_6 TaxID=1974650 RepID=A0A2M6W0W2_9BACT|nr:MAG: hypothetical protein COU33_03200 [Candidatus Magasanikbacteria bacterium CG10_big_fil_rev_8_21_14_0_10_43_6]
MHIAIDIRPLMHKERTGVGMYTHGLLDAVFQVDTDTTYYLFYNSYADLSAHIPVWSQKNVHIIHTRWPNKLLHILVLLKCMALDKLVLRYIHKHISDKVDHLDYFFSPNIHFTHISKKTKHILTMHDLTFALVSYTYSWRRRLWHWFLRPKQQCAQAQSIVVPSDHTAQDLVALWGVPREKITVLSPGVGAEFLAHISDPLQDAAVRKQYALPNKYVLFLGTLEPRKNVCSLIEAFCRSGIRDMGYTLIIAGPRGWKDTPILHAIERSRGVAYIGYVAPEDKPILYRLATLFVYPSWYEGFGLPVLEAFTVGTPVITSNRSSLPEVAGDAAYLVHPENISDIAEGLRRLVQGTAVQHILQRKGYTVAKKFSWRKSADTFLAILRAA